MGADQYLDWAGVAASALEWWHEAGVECLTENEPRDWLAEVVASPSGTENTPVATPSEPLPQSLEPFLAWRLGPDAPDSNWGKLLPPSGDATADLMVLVDMPEREDAANGQLLSGAAGRLFDRMLAAIGYSRKTIYLASLAVARPASRTIARETVEALAELARHHIALAGPRRLLVMGDTANRALLGTNAAASGAILHAVKHASGETAAVATFHPRFLLANPGCKARAWSDLQMLVEGLTS